MKGFLASVGLSFLVGCGGNLESRVDSSIADSSGNSESTNVDHQCPPTHNLVKVYDSVKNRVLDYGLKTKSMNRIYKMAENQMDLAKFYDRYGRFNDSAIDCALFLNYFGNALNLLLELTLQQDDLGYNVSQKLPSKK